MEHIMKTGAGWEIKADSHRVDELGDAVRPIVARLQLPLGRSLQRGCRAVALTQPNPIAHGVGDGAVALVVVPLGDGLGLLQAVAHISQQLVAVRHVLGDGSDSGFTRLIRADGGGFAPVDDVERSVLERRLVRRVVDELCPRQPAQPLARTISGEAPQVHGDHLVGGLSLAIRLGMEGRRHV